MGWLSIRFRISNTCGVRSNWLGQNRETDGEHDEDCIEEMERDREAFGIGYYSIII